MVSCCSEPYGDSLKANGLKGPWQHHRKCTDVLMLLIFVAFNVAWVGILIFASEHGDIYRLLNGVDSFGNVCGRNNNDGVTNKNMHIDMTNYPYLYYTDPNDRDAAPAVCVAKCPYHEDSTFTEKINACTGCTDNSGNTTADSCGSCALYSVCVSATGSGPYTANSDMTWASSNNYCPPYAYATKPIVGRCWPSENSYSGVSGADTLTQGFVEIIDKVSYTVQLYEYFYTARYQVMWTALAALAISLVLMLLLRLIVAPVVWGVVIGVVAASIGAAYVMWLEYSRVNDDIEDKKDAGGGVTDAEENNRDFYLTMAIIITLVAVILFFVTVAMRSRISMAINIFVEASRALAARPVLFLSPFLTYLILLAYIVLWIYGALLITTTDDRVYDNSTGYTSFEHDENPDEDEYQLLVAYHIFALLWIAQFIIASGNFVISGTVATWYFTQTGLEPNAPKQGYIRSIWIYIRYHLGTVAFGSLIIAIIQAARLVLEYIRHKFEEEAGCIGRFVMRCMACCLWCLEKCMKYINKNAYIITNLHGYSFCSAAWTAFGSLMDNALLVAAINGVGFLVITLFKILISGLTVLIAFWLVSSDNEGGTEGTNNQGSWFILFFAAFIGWLIATVFFELYTTIVDTVAMCFMEDKKYNDGSAEKPYHASDGLQKFLHHASGKGSSAKRSKTKRSQVAPV